MIEYATDNNKLPPAFMRTKGWLRWSMNFKMGEFRFTYLNFRINGVVYKEYTKEFLNEYSKLKFWETLSEK